MKNQKTMKKQKYIPGGIVRIPLEDGYHIYGQLLVKPYVVFYDYKLMKLKKLFKK
jgi:hypothetical protein